MTNERGKWTRRARAPVTQWRIHNVLVWAANSASANGTPETQVRERSMLQVRVVAVTKGLSYHTEGAAVRKRAYLSGCVCVCVRICVCVCVSSKEEEDQEEGESGGRGRAAG